jgi:hypothetical protein
MHYIIKYCWISPTYGSALVEPSSGGQVLHLWFNWSRNVCRGYSTILDNIVHLVVFKNCELLSKCTVVIMWKIIDKLKIVAQYNKYHNVTKKSTVFPASIFTKLTNDQQCYKQTSYTKFRQNRANAVSTVRKSSISLSKVSLYETYKCSARLHGDRLYRILSSSAKKGGMEE